MTALRGRERRMGLHLPVEVEGQDVAGRSFQEQTRSLNVSGGGIGFETSQALLMGSRLVIHIQLPPPLRRHFRGLAVYHVRAVVCRVEAFQGGGRCRVGARFLAEV